MNEIKNLDGEVWKPMYGYEGFYEISNMGRIKSLPRNNVATERIIKPHINKHNGYMYVSLSKNNERKTRRVHPLVMKSFTDYRCDGYDPNQQIDHINCDKTDNRLENLEVVTQSENGFRAWRNGLITPCSKKVICLDTGIVYDSLTEAAHSVGGRKCGSITRVCQGIRSHYRNFHFAYYDDYLNGTIPPFRGRNTKRSSESLWVK